LVVDVFPCEDGHTPERALLDQILPTAAAGDLWIGDRNFCTLKFLLGVAGRRACFVVRQHQNLPWQADSDLEYAGDCDGGEVWEQRALLEHPETAGVSSVRRVELRLRAPTRDGDAVIHLLTDLPPRVASARVVARLYRERWTIEGAFQILEASLASEQPRLGYPRAGLFAFCVALVSYNVLAVVRAALRAVHGREAAGEVSTYYLAAEVKGVYQGMMIALPAAEWQPFRRMGVAQLAAVLKGLARRVDLSRYERSRRGPKKPRPARRHRKTKPHVSTARLIASRRKKKNQSP
jgi:hypothetical protein